MASNNGNYHLAESYLKSTEYVEVRKVIDPVLKSMREEVQKEGVYDHVSRTLCGQQMYATSFFWQVCQQEK